MFSSHKGEYVFLGKKGNIFFWGFCSNWCRTWKKNLDIWTALQKCLAAVGTCREKTVSSLPSMWKVEVTRKLLALFWLVISPELGIIKTNPLQQLPWESYWWSLSQQCLSPWYICNGLARSSHQAHLAQQQLDWKRNLWQPGDMLRLLRLLEVKFLSFLS